MGNTIITAELHPAIAAYMERTKPAEYWLLQFHCLGSNQSSTLQDLDGQQAVFTLPPDEPDGDSLKLFRVEGELVEVSRNDLRKGYPIGHTKDNLCSYTGERLHLNDSRVEIWAARFRNGKIVESYQPFAYLHPIVGGFLKPQLLCDDGVFQE